MRIMPPTLLIDYQSSNFAASNIQERSGKSHKHLSEPLPIPIHQRNRLEFLLLAHFQSEESHDPTHFLPGIGQEIVVADWQHTV